MLICRRPPLRGTVHWQTEGAHRSGNGLHRPGTPSHWQKLGLHRLREAVNRQIFDSIGSGNRPIGKFSKYKGPLNLEVLFAGVGSAVEVEFVDHPDFVRL